MSNEKFNAVTKGFQEMYRICSRRSRINARTRKDLKRKANRAARRAWFDGAPRATDWNW